MNNLYLIIWKTYECKFSIGYFSREHIEKENYEEYNIFKKINEIKIYFIYLTHRFIDENSLPTTIYPYCSPSKWN